MFKNECKVSRMAQQKYYAVSTSIRRLCDVRRYRVNFLTSTGGCFFLYISVLSLWMVPCGNGNVSLKRKRGQGYCLQILLGNQLSFGELIHFCFRWKYQTIKGCQMILVWYKPLNSLKVKIAIM